MRVSSFRNVNCYSILGVRPDCTEKELSQAYRAAALESHPDKNIGDPTATKRFQNINSAHDLLKDPSQREEYDRINSKFLAKAFDRPIPSTGYKDGGLPTPVVPSAAATSGTRAPAASEYTWTGRARGNVKVPKPDLKQQYGKNRKNSGFPSKQKWKSPADRKAAREAAREQTCGPSFNTHKPMNCPQDSFQPKDPRFKPYGPASSTAKGAKPPSKSGPGSHVSKKDQSEVEETNPKPEGSKWFLRTDPEDDLRIKKSDCEKFGDEEINQILKNFKKGGVKAREERAAAKEWEDQVQFDLGKERRAAETTVSFPSLSQEEERQKARDELVRSEDRRARSRAKYELERQTRAHFRQIEMAVNRATKAERRHAKWVLQKRIEQMTEEDLLEIGCVRNEFNEQEIRGPNAAPEDPKEWASRFLNESVCDLDSSTHINFARIPKPCKLNENGIDLGWIEEEEEIEMEPRPSKLKASLKPDQMGTLKNVLSTFMGYWSSWSRSSSENDTLTTPTPTPHELPAISFPGHKDRRIALLNPETDVVVSLNPVSKFVEGTSRQNVGKKSARVVNAMDDILSTICEGPEPTSTEMVPVHKDITAFYEDKTIPQHLLSIFHKSPGVAWLLQKIVRDSAPKHIVAILTPEEIEAQNQFWEDRWANMKIQIRNPDSGPANLLPGIFDNRDSWNWDEALMSGPRKPGERTRWIKIYGVSTLFVEHTAVRRNHN